MRIEFAGATAITIKAVNAPSREHVKIIKIDRRERTSPHHQTATIDNPSIVIISAVGGSEKPPMTRGMMNAAACTQREGTCSFAFLICLNKKAPKKGIKTMGAR